MDVLVTHPFTSEQVTTYVPLFNPVAMLPFNIVALDTEGDQVKVNGPTPTAVTVAAPVLAPKQATELETAVRVGPVALNKVTANVLEQPAPSVTVCWYVPPFRPEMQFVEPVTGDQANVYPEPEPPLGVVQMLPLGTEHPLGLLAVCVIVMEDDCVI